MCCKLGDKTAEEAVHLVWVSFLADPDEGTCQVRLGDAERSKWIPHRGVPPELPYCYLAKQPHTALLYLRSVLFANATAGGSDHLLA